MINLLFLNLEKIAILVTKAELKAEQDKIIKLQAFHSSYFRGKSHFEADGTQNYLAFQPMYRYFKKIGNTECISSWKSKGLSDVIVKPPTTSDNNLAPGLSYVGNKAKVNFDGGCLKQDKITFTRGTIVSIYIFYELSLSNHRYDDFPVLENYLFGAAKLTKNGDIDKYKYFGYGIGFDRCGYLSVPNEKFKLAL